MTNDINDTKDTMDAIIRDAHALAQSPAAEDLIRAGAETIARRLERLVAHGLYITPKKALDEIMGNPPMDATSEDGQALNRLLKDAPQVDVPPADAPISPDAPEMVRGEEREHMSRAEAVLILMRLQGIEARYGHANINAALEMAIAAVLKRHRDTCRNKAKRRAARMAEAAKKEVA